MSVGFVGLGHMGAPMARRVAEAGVEVTGYDASDAARDASGLTTSAKLSEVARTCETVILSLPSSDVVDVVVSELFAEPNSAVKIIVDTSSSVPERTQALAATAAGHGIAFVDAPVSGGVPRAVDGTLTVMVGGSEADVERVRPILEAIGSRIWRVGPSGAGHAVKALNNLLSAAHLLTSCEALLAAESFGVDPTTFVEVVNTSSGRSGSTELKLPRYVIPQSWTSGFSAALLDKDARIAAQLVEGAGLQGSLGSLVAARWADLTALLEPGADHTEIIRPMQSEADRWATGEGSQ